MSRFYVTKESIRGNVISITGREAHHILDVMRLKKFDKVIIFDGTGKEYIGYIKDTLKKSLEVEITETRKSSINKSPEITLVQSVPKKEKMDYIVEKSTELGVSSIIPILTDRTIVNWDEAKARAAVERWRKIALEASKQCGRTDIPDIGTITEFTDFVRRSKGYDLILIAALSHGSTRLKDALKEFKGDRIAVLIGPEGDFTPGEISAAKESNFKLVTLGPRVLKSDTAGLAVLAILNYELAN